MDVNRKTAAAIVSTRVEGEPCYAMFEAERVTPEGAFLAGPLLLEVQEDFTVELALPDGDKVRTRARVVRVDRGAVPGMDVSFIDLPDEAKRKLTNGRND
jgi:hypothetical protein